MIGTRHLLAVTTVGVAVAIGLGGGAPRPEVELAARRLVTDAAEAADTELASLQVRLAPAVDAARAGAARVVAGDLAPGEQLQLAAELLDAAAPLAATAVAALAGLESARRAIAPSVHALPPAPQATELTSIATQLAATIEAADTFVQMRRRAQGVTAELEAALAALSGGTVETAAERVAAARADYDAVARWDVDYATLPIWIETSDAMIGDVERIIEATRDGDDTGAREAAADFAALSEADAERADRALRIALGEGGSAVTSAPLSRIAAALAAVADARAAIAALRQGSTP